VRTLYRRQILWAAAGMGGYVAAAVSDYRRLRDHAWWVYGVSVVLLVAVLLIGTRIYGARRWLIFLGVGVQPSEIAKLAVIVLLAVLLSPPTGFEKAPSLWGLLALAGIPMVLIVKEPDLGTGIIFVPVVLTMLYVAGAPARTLGILVAIGLVAVVGVVAAVVLPERLGMAPEEQEQLYETLRLSKYQRNRIAVFLEPDRDPTGAGWNRRQSEIAVGSGGLWGHGYRRGRQNLLGFLPRTVAPTDFIFAVIAEETGFVGSATVLALYALVIGSGLYAGLVARDKLGRVLCAGVVAMLFSHVFVNVAMTVGLMPVTGLPLPLLSYGGTFTVCTLTLLGLVQSVHVRRQGAPA
jgi:rod shape determining protein RodA